MIHENVRNRAGKFQTFSGYFKGLFRKDKYHLPRAIFSCEEQAVAALQHLCECPCFAQFHCHLTIGQKQKRQHTEGRTAHKEAIGMVEENKQNPKLDYTRRYSPLRGLTSSSCGGLRPRLFLPFGQKKSLLYCFGRFLAFFGLQ